MSTPGKLQVDASTGRVTGPANLKYNTPFPTHNGGWGSGAMTGLLMHTMVGNLQPGTVDWFNNPASQASANFGVAQDGTIWQWGPLGKGWYSWHAAEANKTWYGCEFADDGKPANPLTAAQITAAAQLLELLSRFAGFPLQISDSPSVKGFGWHGMGGAAFGGHFNCPGDVRKAQRPQIITLAAAIRSGGSSTVTTPPAASPRPWTTAGMSSLAQLAHDHGTQPSTILRLTAEHSPGAVFDAATATWINAVFSGSADPSKPVPKGLALWLP